VDHLKVSPDVKLVKGGLLLVHSVRSLGDLTCCNAFIFSRLAPSARAVNPVSAHAHGCGRTGSRIIHFALQSRPQNIP
jgi:hypothetical protein